MKFNIQHQTEYSRIELILRSFFGFLYIVLPHAFLLLFVGLWGAILTFISFWSILFTGRYPQSFFEFQVGLIRWNTRVNARIWNLADDYPAFGINADDPKVEIDIPYPANLSRGLQIIKLLFGGFYVGIPHGFILMFRYIWAYILAFVAFWVVLFTGKYPEAWHEFIVGTMRWGTRVTLYLYYMSDDYPPFSARPDDDAPSAAADIPPANPTPAPEPTPEPPADGGGEDANAESTGAEENKE